MLTKDYSLRVKQLDGDGIGSFVGYGSVYGNTDFGGDVVLPGAFTKTLQSSGGIFPLLWQHDSREPIGNVKATDSDYGLLVSGKLLMNLPTAQKAYQLLQAQIIKGMSIGYDTIRSADGPDGGRLLQELRLWELSLVTFPMNESARITSLKAVDNLSDIVSLLQTIPDDAAWSDPDTKAQLVRVKDEVRRLLARIIREV